jgi:hypothetical protein
MWTDNLTIRKFCTAGSDDTTFDVSEIWAYNFAEVGAWDWVTSVTVDGVEIEYDGLFGNTQSPTSGQEDFTWLGTEMAVTFSTDVPIFAFATVPSERTTVEPMTATVANDIAYDFEAVAYPGFALYGDLGVVSNFVMISGASAADRFMDRFAVISSCNSLDTSAWYWTETEIPERCTYDTATLGYICTDIDHDLKESGGVFQTVMPSIWMDNTQHLTSDSCFETHYTIYNEDGSDYTGPLYFNTEGLLTLDDPYSWVSSRLGSIIEITKQQPISDFAYTLPTMKGAVRIIDTDAYTDCSLNYVACATDITSTNGIAVGSRRAILYDNDQSTVYSANCDENNFAEVTIRFAETIPLQTVAILTENNVEGTIFAYGEDSTASTAVPCVDQEALNGYHQCAMWASGLTIQSYCSGTSTTFDIAEIAAVTLAEAGAWNYVSSVSVDGTDLDNFDGLFGNSQSNYGVDGFLWYGVELNVEFMTIMPITAFVTIPSVATEIEAMSVFYDDETSDDFYMLEHPEIGIYNDFVVEKLSQHVMLTALGDPKDRFVGRLGVFSPCNSLDNSYFHFDPEDLGTVCVYTDNTSLSCIADVDIASSAGIFD